MTAEYESWIKSEGAIEASKVLVKESDANYRGLFATQDIFPGERILFVPARLLVGEEMLQSRPPETDLQRETALDLESVAIEMINEIKALILAEEESMVKFTAKTVQYEWRGDDAVALYLMACKKIIGMDLPSRLDEAGTLVFVSREDNTADEEVLVEGIISVDPITDEVPYVNPAAEVLDFEVVSNQAKLKESRPPSFLPHVTMLPDSFPLTPLYYNEDDLSRLDGTNCHEFVTRMLEQIQTDWIQISAILRAYLASEDRSTRCSHCDDDDGCLCRAFWDPGEDFEWYKWSLCNIYSRSTDFVISDRENQTQKRVIVPIFDMINHDFTSDVYHAMDQDGNVSVFNGSRETIYAGSEIFLNYGNFPNEKLLSIYGFVVEENPFDAVQIYAPIRPSDPLYEAKARVLLSKCEISDVTAPHPLHLGSNPIIPHTLLSVLRIVGIQSLEEIWAVAQHGDNGFIGMINRENEQSALSALGHALHTMARRIALSMISDENLNAAANSIFPPVKSIGMDLEVFSSNQPITLNQSERAESADEKNQNGDANLRNASILCRSEYRILQEALNEISDRLEKIQTADSVSSID